MSTSTTTALPHHTPAHAHTYTHAHTPTQADRQTDAGGRTCCLLVEPDDGVQVQVVGGLVQHQQGGLHEQGSMYTASQWTGYLCRPHP